MNIPTFLVRSRRVAVTCACGYQATANKFLNGCPKCGRTRETPTVPEDAGRKMARLYEEIFGTDDQ